MGSADLKVWLHRRQRPQRYAYLEELLANRALTPGQLRRRQQAALAAMVEFARDHTRYYRERFGTIGHFADLPVLTKDDVRARLPDLLADDHEPASTPLGHTGGSTGTPLAFYYDEEKHERMRAGMMRSYMLSGWRPGQKILNFWGARQDTVSGGVFGGARLDDFIAAETTLPAHEIDAAKLHDWARFIQRYRPALLQGYASILATLARCVIDARLEMPGSLIGVYSTAEVLTPEQREAIERAFSCKVFNQYGSREIPNIACECRHGGMHVFTDLVCLESVEGSLLVTSLTNRLMPMIRYENGDSGELLEGECGCGLPFPLMQMGVCRQNDFITAPGGRRLHPSFFNRLLYGMTQVSAYQFVQEVPDAVTLRLAGSPLSADDMAQMQAAVAAEGLRLEIEAVPEIERTLSGKHRFVISRLSA
jgi:phenylacetate-CoA ligase